MSRSQVLVLGCAALLAACVEETNGGGDPHHEHSVVRVDDEPQGANCKFGGTAIHTGIDANDNAFLDDDEIVATEYLCAETSSVKCIEGNMNVPGPVSLRDAADFTALAGVQCIEGDLMVVGSTLASLPALPDLEIVTGSVLVAGNTSLTSLDGLAGIREVGRKYVVQGNDSLTTLGPVGSLRRFGSVSVIGNDGLVDLTGLEGFTDIDGGLQIANNSNLTSLHGLENLIRGTREGILIRANRNLTSVAALSNLRSAVLFEISGNASLPSAPLQSLEKVDVYILIKDNAELTSLSLPTLFTTGGLLVQSNPALVTLQAPALKLSGAVTVEHDTSLTSIDLSQLSYITVNADFVNLPQLTTASFGALVAIGGPLQMYQLPQLANLNGFSSLTAIGGNFTLRSCGNLDDFSGFTSLVDVANMTVTENSQLSTFAGLDSFTKVGGDLTITSNPDLAVQTSQAFASSITVVGNVTIN